MVRVRGMMLQRRRVPKTSSWFSDMKSCALCGSMPLPMKETARPPKNIIWVRG